MVIEKLTMLNGISSRVILFSLEFLRDDVATFDPSSQSSRGQA